MPFPLYVPDFMTDGVTPEAIEFTSRSEIERLFSFKGVTLHLDDTDSDDDNYLDGTDVDVTPANVISEIITRVTARIMEYLAPRYAPEDIYQKTRIREIATYMAARELSRRRGNEAVFDAEVAESIETLERYREGTLYLNAPSSPRVYTQSYVTDNRYFRNPTRVLRAASTSTVSGQHVFWDNFPFFWL